MILIIEGIAEFSNQFLTKKNANKMKKIFIFLALILNNIHLFAQNCSVNAGSSTIICGTSYTLNGSVGINGVGDPEWTLISKPVGAPDPVISDINSYTPTITQMTYPGNYVFMISQNCTSGTSSSNVTITAPGEVTTFTAGADITSVSALTGVATLNATIPDGYSASWTFYNIYNFERYGTYVTTNATMSGITTATPTLTLTNKSDHTIDPAYKAVLRITSEYNPNCWYEDEAVVRFVPNPEIILPPYTEECGDGLYYQLNLANNSPKFAHTNMSPNAAGNIAFGTTITLTQTSAPPGGSISFTELFDDRLNFNPITVPGVYKFTLTINNSNGTYTTPEITFNYLGNKSQHFSFLDAERPEQMMLWNNGGSGGEVHCDLAGKTTPITFYYNVHPSDDPELITSTVTYSGILPPGGAPSILNSGANLSRRSATITPPPGGWRIGTYKFTVTRADICSGGAQSYYIHVSDGNREDVKVEDLAVCYPGSGVVTATVPLPDVYKGIINTSYFQDFDGRYDITLVSKPAGAADPVFEPFINTKFTNTSTTISNLNKEGEYIFNIKLMKSNSGVGDFLEEEYACSGASMEDTFSIFVSAQINANAGSDFEVIGVSEVALNGNNPGVATGTWTLVSKPAGAPDPVIEDPSLYNTNVTGLNDSGTYTFKWTISTGSCTSEDTLNVTIAEQCENNTVAVFYSADNSSNRYRNNPPPTNVLLPFISVSDISGGVFGATSTNGDLLNACPVIAGVTYFRMTGITNALQTDKYYSFNITTASNAPILNMDKFSAITPGVYTSGAGASQLKLNYHLRVAIVDPETSEIINLGEIYINSSNPANTNLELDYKLQPGKTYEVRLYPWNSNGHTTVYLDNPRLFLSPVPATSEISFACLGDLSGTVGTALASFIDSDIPASYELRWLLEGADVTASPIDIGTFTPIYYNNSTNCYVEVGLPVTVIACTSGPSACYIPGATTGGAILDTPVGISSLGRERESSFDNWPMARKGGWLVLESKTKGFVPNRVAFDTAGLPIGIPTDDFVEGMLVYDITNKCMKLYTSIDEGETFEWYCITTQTCPE